MKEEVHAPDCERENDLIAFVYGELDHRERTAFRGHMQDCRSCSSEFAEFTNIRESVVAWRNEALVGVTSPAVQASPVGKAETPGSTALTALREFFNLSPLWMKGAVVFASLLFCLFAVLAVARLRETPPAPVAGDPNRRTYSQQEFSAVVALRVQDELQRIKKSTELVTKPAVNTKAVSERTSAKRTSNRDSEVAANVPHLKARRPLSKVERQQLAADLRLIAGPTEGDLDWLDDRINQ